MEVEAFVRTGLVLFEIRIDAAHSGENRLAGIILSGKNANGGVVMFAGGVIVPAFVEDDCLHRSVYNLRADTALLQICHGAAGVPLRSRRVELPLLRLRRFFYRQGRKGRGAFRVQHGLHGVHETHAPDFN